MNPGPCFLTQTKRHVQPWAKACHRLAAVVKAVLKGCLGRSTYASQVDAETAARRAEIKERARQRMLERAELEREVLEAEQREQVTLRDKRSPKGYSPGLG